MGSRSHITIPRAVPSAGAISDAPSMELSDSVHPLHTVIRRKTHSPLPASSFNWTYYNNCYWQSMVTLCPAKCTLCDAHVNSVGHVTCRPNFQMEGGHLPQTICGIRNVTGTLFHRTLEQRQWFVHWITKTDRQQQQERSSTAISDCDCYWRPQCNFVTDRQTTWWQ